jgi:hypothetical protein
MRDACRVLLLFNVHVVKVLETEFKMYSTRKCNAEPSNLHLVCEEVHEYKHYKNMEGHVFYLTCT